MLGSYRTDTYASAPSRHTELNNSCFPSLCLSDIAKTHSALATFGTLQLDVYKRVKGSCQGTRAERALEVIQKQLLTTFSAEQKSEVQRDPMDCESTPSAPPPPDGRILDRMRACFAERGARVRIVSESDCIPVVSLLHRVTSASTAPARSQRRRCRLRVAFFRVGRCGRPFIIADYQRALESPEYNTVFCRR
ncbi:hypothetical protein BD626DRAFT_130776 [Schizophyllum amplum]|uniref:Uncharacterized protein n=1 Tax=Schizophyllum amplum TaxID=97359 RepID=A0A550C695_9AGAR|nr:hypothetical protein BD626DRAFT_130776 [Auriculariopsis ampla]